jgi:hypothetical protein
MQSVPKVCLWIALQLSSYGIVLWIVFIGIAFLIARYCHWWCIPLGQLGIAILIMWSDFNWIQSEMRKPGWNGMPDMDAVFYLGVSTRIILVNTALLPANFLGIRIRRKAKGRAK